MKQRFLILVTALFFAGVFSCTSEPIGSPDDGGEGNLRNDTTNLSMAEGKQYSLAALQNDSSSAQAASFDTMNMIRNVTAGKIHDSIAVTNSSEPRFASHEDHLQALLDRIDYGNNVSNYMTLAKAYRDNYDETRDDIWLTKSKKNQRTAKYWVRKYDSISRVLRLPVNQGNLH